jgi:hypothetical protein
MPLASRVRLEFHFAGLFSFQPHVGLPSTRQACRLKELAKCSYVTPKMPIHHRFRIENHGQNTKVVSLGSETRQDERVRHIAQEIIAEIAVMRLALKSARTTVPSIARPTRSPAASEPVGRTTRVRRSPT